VHGSIGAQAVVAEPTVPVDGPEQKVIRTKVRPSNSPLGLRAYGVRPHVADHVGVGREPHIASGLGMADQLSRTQMREQS
jgi:hypothetical protein